MKLQGFRITMLVLTGALFLSVSSVYADTAAEHAKKGMSYTLLDYPADAVSEFNKAIELDPNNYEYYSWRADAYAANKEYDQAISDYNKAIKINPKYAVAYCDLAKVYQKTGQYDLAWKNVHKAEELGYAVRVAWPEFITRLQKASGRDK